eukprot:Sspe_Gene.2475::Locus_820_Transcript_1_1_Confidence_1.000_Length_2730::g.2475::m.2475
MALQIGTPVVCRGAKAVVKYIGPLHHAPGQWVGIEFEEPGPDRNDGTSKGKKYFECRKGHGLFVRPGSLHKQLSEQGSSAPTLHHNSLHQLNAFDSASENDFLRVNAGIGHAAESFVRENSTDLLSPSVSRHPLMLPEVESTYQGPHLEIKEGEPLTDEQLSSILSHIKKTPDVALHPRYLIELLRTSTAMFRRQCPQALLKLTVPTDGQLMTCGDIHGQLEDLLWIFFKHGPPSADRVYLMNGDIADRGGYAVECFIVLLCHKLRFPESVWINKGNHEDDFMNLRYGFHREVKDKYPEHSGAVYHAFQELFYVLPLATTINNKVFVVHGGLFRRPVRLAQLCEIDHCRGIPETPHGSFRDMMFYDALWSDPHIGNGIMGNPRGGDVISFGTDITHRFLMLNSLRMVIRAHQVPESTDSSGYPRGYEWVQPFPRSTTVKPLSTSQMGMLLTVFSASNYTGTAANMGAVVVFRGSVENFEVLEHYAQPLDYLLDVEQETIDATQQLRRVANMEKDGRQRQLQSSTGLMDCQIMDRLKHLIVRRKHELFEWFWSVDEEKDQHVSPEMWREGCSCVLTDELPWQTVQEKLGVVDPVSNRVCYTSFLSRFQIRFRNKFGLHAGFRRAITDRVFETLLLTDLSLRETFAVLDRNDDGLVSLREFQEVLSNVGTGLTRSQIQALLQTTAAHASHPGANGKLSVDDFLARLQLKYSSTHAKPATKETMWVPQFLGKLAKDIVQQQQKTAAKEGLSVLQGDGPVALLTEFFNRSDQNRNGFLEKQEFIDAIKPLPSCKALTAEQLDQIGVYCDVVGNGRINYLEFLHAFHIEDTAGPGLAEDVLEQVHRVLYFDFSIPLMRSLRVVDEEDTGRVTAAQFERVLETVNNLT